MTTSVSGDLGAYDARWEGVGWTMVRRDEESKRHDANDFLATLTLTERLVWEKHSE